MDDELVTIATTYDLVEAEFLRNYLEAEGFEVFLADENIVGAYNLLANAVGGIKIKVLSADAEDALAFVDNWKNAEIIEDEMSPDIDTGWGECDKCHSHDLKPYREALGWRGFWFFFILPFPRPKPTEKLICNNCNFEKIMK